jgi:hypothetical protein
MGCECDSLRAEKARRERATVTGASDSELLLLVPDTDTVMRDTPISHLQVVGGREGAEGGSELGLCSGEERWRLCVEEWWCRHYCVELGLARSVWQDGDPHQR